MMNKEIFSQLIYESESSRLDFKREPYKFIDASDSEKAELLKDVIAMVNAHRTEPAYIIIGVAESETDRPHTLVGINWKVDDATLQQFINTKLHSPCKFSYYVFPYNGMSFGIIEIPVQDRPVFLRRSFGGLTPDSVYVRRGSSTAIAKPDEIAKMSIGYGDDTDNYYGRVSLHALKVIREKGFAWEYRLLSQLLLDEVKSQENQKLDYKFGIFFNQEPVSDDDITTWFSTQMPQFLAIIRPLKAVMDYIKVAVGPFGVPGDVDKIIYVAKSMGRIYASSIDWAIKAKCTVMDSTFDEAREAMSECAFLVIDSFESFCQKLKNEMDRVMELHRLGQEVDVSINWVVPGNDELFDRSISLYRSAINKFMRNK